MRVLRRPSRLGVLRSMAVIAVAGGAYAVYLMACSSGNPLAPNQNITPSSPPHGTYAVPYSQTFTVTNSTINYAWTVVDPTKLPPGLTLSTGGVLSGTPDTGGVFDYKIVATDPKSGAVDTATICMNIFFAVTPAALPPGTVGAAYSQQLGGKGGTPPYASWALFGSSNQLPTGVTLSGAGLLSGTPAAGTAGTYVFSVQGFDANGAIGRKTDTLVIVAAGASLAITTKGPALPGGTEGDAYDGTGLTFAASGGTAPYTWGLATGSGPLPPTLTINPSTGLLSGTTTTAGMYSFTVQATDNASPHNTATAPFTINVLAPLTITTASPLAGGTVGTAYNTTGVQFTATGGTTPYSWLITSAASTVPAGLSLSTSGLLSGTPTGTGGTFTFTVQATDATLPTAMTASKSFTVTIAAGSSALVITTASPLPSATEGTYYSQQLSASGGTSPYTWKLTSAGSMPPAGTSLSTSGLVSGTPTSTGGTTFPVTVTDNVGATATKSFQMTVNAPSGNCAILVNGVQTTTLPGATYMSVALYTVTLTATSACIANDPGYSIWGLASGSTLPSGFVLASSTTNSTTLSSNGIGAAPTTYTFSITFHGQDTELPPTGQNVTTQFTLVVSP